MDQRQSDPGDEQRRARVSAIMDGQADAAQWQQWLADEAPQSEVRQAWREYHLIGDVMRSSDLATTAERDQQLLARVQQGVAQEPVVWAPTAVAPIPAVRPVRVRRRLWAGTAAALAGVLVVGGAYLTTRVESGPIESVVSVVSQPWEDLRRASVGATTFGTAPSDRPTGAEPGWAAGMPLLGFREILRLPRGPAHQPLQSVQVLYSNGSATISVITEPFRAGEHVARTETSERLNTLTVQRDGAWLTLSGDVPMGTLQQMALALRAQP